MNGPRMLQVEGMRPFLYTAPSREAANIIADMICVYYGQETVMTGIWALNVRLRDKRKGLNPTTNAWRRRWVTVRSESFLDSVVNIVVRPFKNGAA